MDISDQALLTFISMGIFAQKLKVVAYNVEFAKNTTPEEMAEYLQSEKADIICFNEVPAQGWAKHVGDIIGLPCYYEGEIASANHTEGFNDKTGKYFGKYKSILSKFPLENTHKVDLEGGGWSRATAVSATVKIDKSVKVQILSLHIPSGKSNPDNSKAFHLAQILNSKYADVNKMIVAGDFNDLYDSKPLKYLYSEGLENPWKSLDIDLSEKTTYPGSMGYVIDHILFKGFKEKENPLSDHSAVWTVLKFKKNKKLILIKSNQKYTRYEKKNIFKTNG